MYKKNKQKSSENRKKQQQIKRKIKIKQVYTNKMKQKIGFGVLFHSTQLRFDKIGCTEAAAAYCLFHICIAHWPTRTT